MRANFKGRAPLKKRRDFLPLRKKVCRFCLDKTSRIDYKDLKRLESLMTPSGKILYTRLSGNCARHQRMVAEAIKKARFLALLPYVR
jgi:small subunit ribosomal protein S18